MIRFLKLKNQITEDSNDFAFYDTTNGTICSFGEHNEQLFDCISDFEKAYENEKKDKRPLSRYLRVIPPQ